MRTDIKKTSETISFFRIVSKLMLGLALAFAALIIVFMFIPYEPSLADRCKELGGILHGESCYVTTPYR